MKRSPDLKPTKQYPKNVWLRPDGSYHVRERKRHPKTGKPVEIDQAVDAKNPKDAYEQLCALMAIKLKGANTRGPVPHVLTYADTWVGRKKAEGKAPGTITRYVRDLKNHLEGKPLADIYVDRVTHSDVLDWRDSLPGTGITVNSVFRILRTMMRAAWLEYDLPGRCPVDGVKAVQESKPYTPDEPGLLTLEELRELLAGAERVSPKWYPLIATWAYTGLRVSEACTLRWEDIRTNDKRHGPHILLRRTWSGPVVYTRLKAEDFRMVPLCDELAGILQAHRRELLSAQASNDPAAQANAMRRVESGWLFPTKNGVNPIARQTSANILHAIQNKLLAEIDSGVSPCLTLTPKGLRRTFNDLLRQAAPESVVRALMGHMKAEMTDRYSMVRVQERGAAVRVVFGAVAPPLAEGRSPTPSPVAPPISPILPRSSGIGKTRKPR